MITLRAVGIGVCASGMPGWPEAHAILRGDAPWVASALPKLDIPLLPVAERRRINPASRLAITAAMEAMAGVAQNQLPGVVSVFATADGDGQVLANTMRTLAEDAAAMSPTLFHNSVFNAAAGYWTIACGSRAASITVSAGKGSFAAGLLEAAVQSTIDVRPVLYLAVDMPFPESLASFEVGGEPFACALLLVPGEDASSTSAGSLRVGVASGDGDWTMNGVPAAVASAFRANPAAAALPLLRALARGEPGGMRLPYLDGCRVDVHYDPC